MRENECAGINKTESEAGVNRGDGKFKMGGSSDEDEEEGQDNNEVWI